MEIKQAVNDVLKYFDNQERPPIRTATLVALKSWLAKLEDTEEADTKTKTPTYRLRPVWSEHRPAWINIESLEAEEMKRRLKGVDAKTRAYLEGLSREELEERAMRWHPRKTGAQ